MKLDERWPWVAICTLAGIGTGLFDFALMLAFGADLRLAGRDVTWAVLASFVLTYSLLGNLVGHLVTAHQRARRDAETISRQYDELRHAQRALVQQEKLAAIGRLAAGVAHEVRNPLGVIRASAKVVQEGFEPGEDAHRACEFICEEIDRLDGLIDGLLSFARPTRLELARTSLSRVLDRAAQLAGDALRRRGIELVRTGDTAGCELRADPDLLAQVVLDLVTNAAEAIEASGRVELRVASDADALRFEVADDGPGVAPEVADSLFEPFVTTKASGTGLGLAMCRRIVEAHGGILEAVAGAGAGPNGRGACFRVRLAPDGGALVGQAA